MMNFIAVIALSFLFLVIVELAKRVFKLKAEDTRKFAHLGGSLIAASLPLFLGRDGVAAAGLLFMVLLLATRRTTLFSSIHGVARRGYGDVYFPASIAICAILFLPHDVLAFQFGMLVMGIADPMAGLIGERFGTHQLSMFGQRKTLEGSSAFFVTTLAIAAAFGIADVRALGMAFFLTFVEASLAFGLDNIAVPILAGLLIQHF
ncbi:MAG: hypothetical protein AAB923_01250 [Patescibacteria group bacterium]